VMFGAFIGLVTAGALKGLKEYKDFKRPEAAGSSMSAQVAAATILENATLAEWTRSNHAVVAALERLCDTLSRNLDETAELRRTVADAAHDIRAHRG
jgi:hypothetical protein